MLDPPRRGGTSQDFEELDITEFPRTAIRYPKFEILTTHPNLTNSVRYHNDGSESVEPALEESHDIPMSYLFFE
jgi:hypothetical protein